jgi:hypothetical protein
VTDGWHSHTETHVLDTVHFYGQDSFTQRRKSQDAEGFRDMLETGECKMILNRRGSAGNDGDSRIEASWDMLNWNNDTRTITILSGSVKDFNTDAHHDYEMVIPLSEITELLRELGKAIRKPAGESLALGLKPCIGDLVRLVLAVADLWAPPQDVNYSAVSAANAP